MNQDGGHKGGQRHYWLSAIVYLLLVIKTVPTLVEQLQLLTRIEVKIIPVCS